MTAARLRRDRIPAGGASPGGYLTTAVCRVQVLRGAYPPPPPMNVW